MTSPPPTLRCRSCGYDIASLIDTRGRDQPGVCPECGASIRAQLHNPCVYEVQHAWTIRAYSEWLIDSIVRPSKVARLTYLPTVGKMIKWNLLSASGVFAITVFLYFLFGFEVGSMLEAAAWAMGFAAIGTGLAWFLLYMVSWTLGGMLAGACVCMGLRPVRLLMLGALDISTAWLAAWPFVLPLMYIGLEIAFGVGWIKSVTDQALLAIFGVWLLVPLVSIVVGIRTLPQLARRFEVDA